MIQQVNKRYGFCFFARFVFSLSSKALLYRIPPFDFSFNLLLSLLSFLFASSSPFQSPPPCGQFPLDAPFVSLPPDCYYCYCYKTVARLAMLITCLASICSYVPLLLLCFYLYIKLNNLRLCQRLAQLYDRFHDLHSRTKNFVIMLTEQVWNYLRREIDRCVNKCNHIT